MKDFISKNFIILDSIGCALCVHTLNIHPLAPNNEPIINEEIPINLIFNKDIDPRTLNSREVYDKLSYNNFCDIVEHLAKLNNFVDIQEDIIND